MADNKEQALKEGVGSFFRGLGDAIRDVLEGDATLDDLIDRAPIERLTSDREKEADDTANVKSSEPTESVKKTL